VKIDWTNLNERERWMLGGGGIVCGLYLLYVLIYAPIVGSVREKTTQLVAKQHLLVWMRDARLQYHAASELQALSASKLLTVLASQLAKTSFKQFPYQLQQTGVGDIQLSFDSVPYNALLAWLWSMNNTYAITMKQFHVDRTDTPGLVKVMLMLSVSASH